jgi:hypothetical protein
MRQQNPLTQKQKEVYDLYKKFGPSRPDFIAKQLGFSERVWIDGQMKGLIKKGFLKRCDGEGYKFVHYKIIK